LTNPVFPTPRPASNHDTAAAARHPAEDLRQRGQLLIPADNNGTPHNRILARAQ
jgi:hypothetical protein